MIEQLNKIAPLREDIKRIIPNSFLTSTAFKRWIITIKYEDAWDKCLEHAKDENKVVGLGQMDMEFPLELIYLKL